MTKKPQKLYAYVDESGQDTEGRVFVVSALVTEREQAILQKKLEAIEEESKKRIKKWNKAPYAYRKDYIEKIAQCRQLHRSLYFEIFYNDKKYIKLTSYTTAKAILKKARGDYQATIYIDGFRKKELLIFSQGLSDLRIKKRKVRGVRKDENNPFIRLADALCGLVRDAEDKNNPWAANMLIQLQKRGLVIAL